MWFIVEALFFNQLSYIHLRTNEGLSKFSVLTGKAPLVGCA